MSATDSSREDDCYIRYLLGQLPEEEAERLDELTLVDHEAAARLQAVENDLIDGYVTGALMGSTRATFERIYFGTPRGRAKVRFAQSLREAVTRASDPAASPGVCQDSAADSHSMTTPATPGTAPSAVTGASTASASAAGAGTRSAHGPPAGRGAASSWYAKMTARLLRGGWGLAAMVVVALPPTGR